MTPEVTRAIDQIAKQFPNSNVLIGEYQNGGACVIVESIPLGSPYAQTDTWLGFHITPLLKLLKVLQWLKSR
jgi:hypothetical protein